MQETQMRENKFKKRKPWRPAGWVQSCHKISPEPGTSALMCRLTIYDLLWKNKPGKSCAAVWTWPHNLGPSKPSSCSLNESCLFQAGSITATKISAINNCQRTGFEYLGGYDAIPGLVNSQKGERTVEEFKTDRIQEEEDPTMSPCHLKRALLPKTHKRS